MGKVMAGAARQIRPHIIAGEEHVAAMNEWKAFLANQNRPLTVDELRLVYQNVYPKATLTETDQRLQQGQVIAAEAVAAELGADMQPLYNFLVSSMHFLNAGTRPHNEYTDLPRHLWDTAYRTNLMGLSLMVRQLALVHSLPEYKARGLLQARDVIRAISKKSEMPLEASLESFTDLNAILLDHLIYVIERIGANGNSDNISYIRGRLAKISRNGEREKVEKTLEGVLKLSPQSDKRLVPVALVGDPIYPEARARLHVNYIDGLVKGSDYRSEHSSAPLIVKSLCLIDRLRTADGAVQVEKVTRETADFLPRLDEMLELLHRHKTVNNALEFAAAALKTEFLIELNQRAAQARGMRDTRFAPFADLLGKRLAVARQQYGSAAAEVGYTPVYKTPNLRDR